MKKSIILIAIIIIFISIISLIIFNKDINSKNKINKFTKEKSVFKVERIKYNNENRYKLTPIE